MDDQKQRIIQSSIVDLHREDSQAELLHEDSQGLLQRSMSARIRVGSWEQHRGDGSDQLCKLQSTFRAGVTVPTCVT